MTGIDDIIKFCWGSKRDQGACEILLTQANFSWTVQRSKWPVLRSIFLCLEKL